MNIACSVSISFSLSLLETTLTSRSWRLYWKAHIWYNWAWQYRAVKCTSIILALLQTSETLVGVWSSILGSDLWFSSSFPSLSLSCCLIHSWNDVISVLRHACKTFFPFSFCFWCPPEFRGLGRSTSVLQLPARHLPALGRDWLDPKCAL